MPKRRVVIIGANGRMGMVADRAINALNNFDVIAKIGRERDKPLKDMLSQLVPDVVIELSGHDNVFKHASICADLNLRCVIGSSGLDLEQVNRLSDLFNKKELGGLLVPNFSMAVARFSKTLPFLFNQLNPDDAQICEYHHTSKKDAPSGTARHLASILGLDERSIQSIRDDRYHARHDVIFDVSGDRIVYKVESETRDAYIPGIQASCNHVLGSQRFVIGLENII